MAPEIRGRGRSADRKRFDELGKRAWLFITLSDIYSLTMVFIVLPAGGLGNILVSRQMPKVRPDVAWPAKVVIKLFSGADDVLAEFLPHTATGLMTLFILAWVAQLALGTVTSVYQRELALDLARERGITVAAALDLIGRTTLRQRFGEAIRLGWNVFKAGAIYCLAGAILGLVGWLLVLLANNSGNSILHVVAATAAMPVLLVVGWMVSQVRDRLVGAEKPEEAEDD